MSQDKLNTTAAYALQTPDDSRRLYADWADTYDDGFVTTQAYELHTHVAGAFVKAGGAGPVLDVGAGTGVCGVALSDLGITPLHATDISPEMLEVATSKQVYDISFVSDVTGPLPRPKTPYAGIVSSGTFTTGHVGPDALDNLLTIAAPGALFALSINARHFRSAGFEAKLANLSGQIRNLSLPQVPIYGVGASGPHKDDIAVIALFHKA